VAPDGKDLGHRD